ncbi:MAG: hypothetical protein R2794_13115 [Chitinophagales bacterium]
MQTNVKTCILYACIISVLLTGCAGAVHMVAVERNALGNTIVRTIPADGPIGITQNLYNHFGDSINTTLPYNKNDYFYAYGDWDNDKVPDLFAINTNGYLATDLHIMSGATGFKTYLLQTALPLDKHMADPYMDFQVMDWNTDGVIDLLAIREPIKMSGGNYRVYILSGTNDADGNPFQIMIDSIDLPYTYGTMDLDFALGDYNKDLIPDLFVLQSGKPSGFEPGNGRLTIYSGINRFRSTLFANNIKIGDTKPETGYQIFVDDFVTANDVDLFLLSSEERISRMRVLSGISGFTNEVFNDTLPPNSNLRTMKFFNTEQLIVKTGRDYSYDPSAKFNSEIIPASGSGPRDLKPYAGKWQSDVSGYNVYGSKTATTIEYTSAEVLRDNGFDQITFTFEDGSKIFCRGKSGNIIFFDEKNVKIPHSDISPITETRFRVHLNGKVYTFDRYIPDEGLSIVDIHNEAGYTAEVMITYKYLDFYEREVEVTNAQNETIMLGQDHFFLIPKSTTSASVKVAVVWGKDYTFSVQTGVDICYTLNGTTLNGHEEQDCTVSEDAIRQALLQEKLDEDGSIKDFLTFIRGKIEDGSINAKTMGYASSGNYDMVKQNMGYDKLTKDLYKENENTNIGSLSIGFGASAAYIVGCSIEDGILFPLVKGDQDFTAYYYTSVTPSIGFQFGAVVSIVFSYWMPNDGNFNSDMDQWLWGVGAGAAAEVGATVIGWFDFAGNFQGISISFDAGGEGKALAAYFSHTWYTKLTD